VQPDGKILVGGNAGGAELGRLLPNGDLDVTFTTPNPYDAEGFISIGAEVIYDMAIEPGGAIVVAGDLDAYYTGSDNGMVARLAPDGTLDPAFGDDGIVEDLLASARALVPRGDGTWLVAGTSFTDGAGVAAVLADGSADPAFGMAGIATYNSMAPPEVLTHMALAPDGSIFALGRRLPSEESILARLDASGQLDGSFGTAGLLAPGVTCLDMIAGPSGGVYVAGGDGFRITRYLSTGLPDPGFGENGSAILPQDTDGSARSLVCDDAGRVIAAGYVQNSPYASGFAVVRLLPDGAPDVSFDGDGVARAPVGKEVGVGTAIMRQTNGKLLAGSRRGGDWPMSFLLRFLSDGSIDPTFGTGGVVELGQWTYPRRIVELASGGSVVAARERKCSAYPCAVSLVVMKLDESGALDAAFGTDGIVREPLNVLDPFGDPYGNIWFSDKLALVVYPDGRILTGAATRVGDRDQMLLMGLLPDGQLDATFGEGGRLVLPPAPGNWRVYDAALQPDGKLILGGVGFSAQTGSDFALLRFLP
jgi:uncharacterized delta-60 repeat protein